MIFFFYNCSAVTDAFISEGIMQVESIQLSPSINMPNVKALIKQPPSLNKESCSMESILF